MLAAWQMLTQHFILYERSFKSGYQVYGCGGPVPAIRKWTESNRTAQDCDVVTAPSHFDRTSPCSHDYSTGAMDRAVDHRGVVRG